MRILHTSDWHIGRKLYDRSLLKEQVFFFDWLLELIKSKNVELLLVSGDIFDSATPSGESTELYYDFLSRLSKTTNTKTVITAGNHDSASRLSAPKEFLKKSEIYVSGWLKGTEDFASKAVIDFDGVSVIALPYIPESDILSFVPLEGEISGAERYRSAIKILYEDAYKKAKNKTIIAMGHFFVDGSKTGDSERLVHIGGSLPIRLDDLPSGLSYAALGHLHRPQSFKKPAFPVVYSGSPMPMTFKEAKYEKKVFLLEHKNGKIEYEGIVVPELIKLRSVSGRIDDVFEKLKDIKGAVLDVEVFLDEPESGVAARVKEKVAQGCGEVLRVVANLNLIDSETSLSYSDISSLGPEDIFLRYMDKLPDIKDKEGLLSTFKELIKIEKDNSEEQA